MWHNDFKKLTEIKKKNEVHSSIARLQLFYKENNINFNLITQVIENFIIKIK